MADNVTTTHDYLRDLPPRHTQIIGLKELQKALGRLYGPNWDSQRYDKRFDNIRTSGHVGYCIEFITACINGVDYRVRCGARYKMESGGCGSHPHKKMTLSKNLLIKNMYAGNIDTIDWDDLYNTDMDKQNRVAPAGPTAKQLAHQRVEKLAVYDEEQDAVAGIPANPLVYAPHFAFEEAKKQERDTQAEERKQAVAKKRTDGGVLGRAAQKVKKVIAGDNETVLDKKARQGKSYKTTQKARNGHDPEKFKNMRGGRNASDPNQ